MVHRQLVDDLARLGVATEGTTLSFRYARARGERSAKAHEGELFELTGVRAEDAEGAVLHKGTVRFFHDELARELHLWWERDDGQVPEEIWATLDMGVKRRAVDDPAFAEDARVQSFSAGRESA